MNIYWKQSLRGVPWNWLKSENIEISYVFSAFKEAMQIDYKKACSVMEQAWMSTLTYLLKISLTHFMALMLFCTSWNRSENQVLPDVFRGHWRRPVSWDGLRVIQYSVIYFLTFLSNWRYFIQLKRLLQNEVVNF